MTDVFFSLLASVALTFLWLWFFVRRDRHPEPLWLLARTFGWGMFAWLVAAAFEASLGRVLNSPLPLALLLVALLTAIIEEGSKFLASTTAITEVDFDEPMDGLVYAVTAALGFALMENITYTLGFGGRAGTWHAVVTTLAHALFSAPQGYALGGLHWQRGRRWVIQGPAEQGLDRANWTHAELADHLKKAHGITTSRSAMQRFCRKIDIRPYRPTYRYLRGDPAKQQEARDELTGLKKKRRPGALSS